MNFLALESKFKELEKKEDEVRNYYDPRTVGGKKHYFIHDLKADFQYDNLMYGFSRYLEDSSESIQKPETAPAKDDFVTPPRTSSKDRNHTATGTKRVFAKRKQPEIFEMKEPVNKDRYIGLFSATKIMKPEILEVKQETGGEKQDVWKTSATESFGISNPAAKQRISIPDRQIRTAASMPFKREPLSGNGRLSPIRARTSKTAGKKPDSDLNQMESLTGLQMSVDLEDAPNTSKHEVATQKTVSAHATPKAKLDLKPIEGRGSQLSEDSERMMSMNIEMVKKTDHEWELKGEVQGTYKAPSMPPSDRPKEAEQRFPAISEESIRTPKSFLEPVSETFDEIPLVKIKLLPMQISRKTKSYSVVLTDISDSEYTQEIKAGMQCDEAGFVVGTDGEVFDPLKSLSWVNTPKNLLGKTIRLQVFGIGVATVKLIDRFLHFGPRNDDGERQIQSEIRLYEDYLKEKLGLDRASASPSFESPSKSKSVQRYLSDMIQQARAPPIDPEIPQALFRLPDMGSPHKKVTPAQMESKPSMSHITLSMGGGFYSVSKQNAAPPTDIQPFAEQHSGPDSHFEGFILQSMYSINPTPRNPMTSALYKYRSEANSFKPVTYGANLSIFEAQDMLEERYGGKRPKAKAKKEVETPALGVAGKSFRH